MADHQLPEEDVRVKSAQPLGNEQPNLHRTGRERRATLSYSGFINTKGPTFSTADDAKAIRFYPYKKSIFLDNYMLHPNFEPYTHNFLYQCMQHQEGNDWDGIDYSSFDGTQPDLKYERNGMDTICNAYFTDYMFWRCKKLYWTMSNLMVIDIRPAAKEAQESTVQVIDDIKFLQQQRNIEIVRFIDKEGVFGTDFTYGYQVPTASALQRLPGATIDALPSLEGFRYEWNMPDGEGWRRTLNCGTHVGKVGEVPVDSEPNEYFVRRIDEGFNWNGHGSMAPCNRGYQPEYWNLIAPPRDTYYYHNTNYREQIQVKKWFGKNMYKWYEQLRVFDRSERKEYFCSSSPPQMYWCVNVEGLNETHYLQTYYRLDFGCELEFFAPTYSLPGTTRKIPLMNREFIWHRHTPWGAGTHSVGVDRLDPNYYIWGTKDYFKDPDPHYPHPTPQKFQWPPTTTSVQCEPVFSSAARRTRKRLPAYDYDATSVSVEPGVMCPGPECDEPMRSPAKRVVPNEVLVDGPSAPVFDEDEWIRREMGL